jgi:hypothetical protein
MIGRRCSSPRDPNADHNRRCCRCSASGTMPPTTAPSAPEPCAGNSVCSSGDALAMCHPVWRAADSRICTRPLVRRLRWIIIRRIYPAADEVCLLAGPERPLAQVTQDTSAWPELNVCWLVGMSLDPTCDLGRGPGQSSGCYETLRITTQPYADAAATVVPSAAQPICESLHTFPWGSQTRLLVCTIQTAQGFG